jgi:D-glycero-D-manno-heptose 1,7-bisphosphate phosphatase
VPAAALSLVLLDRDGVINHDSDQYIRSVGEWRPLPGSLAAIARLTAAGFRIAIVTNQSGIGRGYLSEETLAGIHAAMRAQIERAGGNIDAIYYCPHRPDDNCDCRKPKPLLLLQAMRDLKASPAATCYIGDKLTDIEAARSAGVRPIRVGVRTDDVPAAGAESFPDLAAAAEALSAEAAGSL